MMENGTLPTDPPKLSTLQLWEKTLMTSSLSIVIILALFGNAIVVFVFCTHRPLRKFTNTFIVSLAVSDMMVGAVNMPTWIINVVWNQIYSKELQNLWICLDIVAGVASILNLSAVSVYRFFQITKPYKCREIVTKRRVFATVIAIWIFAGVIAMVKGIIPQDKHPWLYRPGYQLLIFITSFIIPLTGISYCYFCIFKEVARQQAQLPKMQSQQQKNHLALEIKAIKTIAIVIVMFVICWCPFFVVILVNGFCKCVCSKHLITFVKIMHYSNSALNPIIYVWYNTQYRKAFLMSITKGILHHGMEYVVNFLNNRNQEGEQGNEELMPESSPIIIKQRQSSM